jgi:hypothetical protein
LTTHKPLYQGSLINRTAASDELVDAKALLAQLYGQAIVRAILFGFAGVAPRSATANLIELLTVMIMKWPGESKVWATQTLNAVSLILLTLCTCLRDYKLKLCRAISRIPRPVSMPKTSLYLPSSGPSLICLSLDNS